MLHFGTGGFRGIIGDDFTKENVRKVAAALARIACKSGDKRAIAVGYDRRFLSEQAAEWFSETLSEYGRNVLLIPHDTPTPSVMFAVKEQKLAYGAMVTASHNPYYFNGIKLFTEGGMDADENFTNDVEREIFLLESGDKYIYEGQAGKIMPFDVQRRYLDFIEQFLSDGTKENHIRILYDNLNGVGAEPLSEMARRLQIKQFDILHENRDAFFSFHNPNPTFETIAPLKERAVSGGYNFVIATDSDADRLGILDEKGDYVDNNHILAALYYYLVRYRKMKGDIVKNCATSLLIDKLADRLGFCCHEVDVGFKNVSQKMEETDALLGGESSGGLTMRGYVKGKDSVFSASLFTEMVARMGKPVSAIMREVDEFADYNMSFVEDAIEMRSLDETRELLTNAMPMISENIVSEQRFGRNVKCILSDGWLLLRLSGTEPTVRLFAELPTQKRAEGVVLQLKEALTGNMKEKVE